jgi:hypothetical protein
MENYKKGDLLNKFSTEEIGLIFTDLMEHLDLKNISKAFKNIEDLDKKSISLQKLDEIKEIIEAQIIPFEDAFFGGGDYGIEDEKHNNAVDNALFDLEELRVQINKIL